MNQSIILASGGLSKPIKCTCGTNSGAPCRKCQAAKRSSIPAPVAREAARYPAAPRRHRGRRNEDRLVAVPIDPGPGPSRTQRGAVEPRPGPSGTQRGAQSAAAMVKERLARQEQQEWDNLARHLAEMQEYRRNVISSAFRRDQAGLMANLSQMLQLGRRPGSRSSESSPRTEASSSRASSSRASSSRASSSRSRRGSREVSFSRESSSASPRAISYAPANQDQFQFDYPEDFQPIGAEEQPEMAPSFDDDEFDDIENVEAIDAEEPPEMAPSFDDDDGADEDADSINAQEIFDEFDNLDEFENLDDESMPSLVGSEVSDDSGLGQSLASSGYNSGNEEAAPDAPFHYLNYNQLQPALEAAPAAPEAQGGEDFQNFSGGVSACSSFAEC